MLSLPRQTPGQGEHWPDVPHVHFELPDSPQIYLIPMACDREFKNGYGDYWVEDCESLEGLFAEGKWVVDWSDS